MVLYYCSIICRSLSESKAPLFRNFQGCPLISSSHQAVISYRARNRIERFLNRIKHFRRLATRYDKHAANFLAMLKLAATHLWLRHNESETSKNRVFRTG